MTNKINIVRFAALVFVAGSLMTGLLVSSFPTAYAVDADTICPPTGTFVTIIGSDGTAMTYPIDGYTFSTKTDKKKDKSTFMFTHEPDDDVSSDTGMTGLSAKILSAIEDGDIIDIHFTSCKRVFTDDGEFIKKHEVWLKDAQITETSETTGDDGFPTEKVTGKFTKVERMTSTSPIGSS